MVYFSRGNFADSLKSHLKLLSPYWVPYRKYRPEIGLNASKTSPKPTRFLWHMVDASWNHIYSKQCCCWLLIYLLSHFILMLTYLCNDHRMSYLTKSKEILTKSPNNFQYSSIVNNA